MNKQASTPKPENAKNRTDDAKRRADCADERLSKDAGYGRTTSKPGRNE
jgi:hypothetical protein